ncbi:MAG: hypothetical protein UHX00_07625 [Caryophanon sp.]|nr:hypothetical protein [Caryophanon sp.]
MLLVNKGKSIGWNIDELKRSKENLGFNLITVMSSILRSWNEDGSNEAISEKDKGLINKAYLGLYHDFHGLAIQIDLIEHLHMNRKGSTIHKDCLYVSQVIENYFSNLRSIYDFMGSLLKLAVKKRLWGQFNFDSLNKLIEAVSNGKTVEKFPEKLNKQLLNIKDEFLYVRDRRDSIIHNGEIISVMTDESGYHIKSKCASSGKEEIVPLFDYLAERTNNMFKFGESIAQIIFDEYNNEYGEIELLIVALEGVCIPKFIEFLDIRVEN